MTTEIVQLLLTPWRPLKPRSTTLRELWQNLTKNAHPVCTVGPSHFQHCKEIENGLWVTSGSPSPRTTASIFWFSALSPDKRGEVPEEKSSGEEAYRLSEFVAEFYSDMYLYLLWDTIIWYILYLFFWVCISYQMTMNFKTLFTLSWKVVLLFSSVPYFPPKCKEGSSQIAFPSRSGPKLGCK